MLEKLLENWLDSASERSYQAVFVQMLSAEGYTVLHSTRHCLLEFGKDVLAIAPEGVGCAFQLKGDPKGRMTVGRFRGEIQGQLGQLMWQAPAYPGFPPGPHRAYLVSNGQFEEEVQTAVGQMNTTGAPAKVELWSRGRLLELCKRHGPTLWPSELADTRAMLELYLTNPRAQLPVATLAGVLESVLALRPTDAVLSHPELSRAASSAALLTGISTAPFAEAENHQAVAKAWSLCCVMLIGAAQRHAGGDVVDVRASLALAENALLDALASLWEEVKSREHYVEGNVLTDPDVYRWRVGVMLGLLAILALAASNRRILDSTSEEELRRWLLGLGHQIELWGEAAVANLLPWIIWLRKADATLRPDLEIRGLAAGVIQCNQPRSAFALPAPYYDFEEVARRRLRLPQVAAARSIDEEDFPGNSFTGEALIQLLARTNLKSSCRALWPEFTKVAVRRFRMGESWRYCLVKAPGGVEETKLYPLTYEWHRLRADAVRSDDSTPMPEYLANRPWLLAMWWQVAPHRLDSGSVRTFADGVLPGWGT